MPQIMQIDTQKNSLNDWKYKITYLDNSIKYINDLVENTILPDDFVAKLEHLFSAGIINNFQLNYYKKLFTEYAKAKVQISYKNINHVLNFDTRLLAMLDYKIGFYFNIKNIDKFKVREIEIANGVSDIRALYLSFMPNLKKVIIPKSLKVTKYNTTAVDTYLNWKDFVLFENCPSLNEVVLDNNNQYLKFKKGILKPSKAMYKPLKIHENYRDWNILDLNNMLPKVLLEWNIPTDNEIDFFKNIILTYYHRINLISKPLNSKDVINKKRCCNVHVDNKVIDHYIKKLVATRTLFGNEYNIYFLESKTSLSTEKYQSRFAKKDDHSITINVKDIELPTKLPSNEIFEYLLTQWTHKKRFVDSNKNLLKINILNKWYSLIITHTNNDVSTLKIDKYIDVAYLDLKKDVAEENISKEIEKCFMKLLYEIIEPIFKKYATRMQLSNYQFEIFRTYKLAGNCDIYKRKIKFDVRLISMPLTLIETTIVHELSHAKVGCHNHCKTFYKIATEQIPEFQVTDTIW